MSYRPNRLRRPASPKKIQALRLAGWRYSSKRSAWVHRAFNGRVGPVFVDPTDNHPRIAETIVIDHQGPRRGWEAPGADHEIELDVVAAAYAPLDEEILIEVVSTAPAVVVVDEPVAMDPPAELTELPRRVLDRHRPELAQPLRTLDLAAPESVVDRQLPVEAPAAAQRPIAAPLAPRIPSPGPAPVAADAIHVQVQLSESEEPRVVRVDGRPPRLRGEDDQVKDDVVVPFKAARAFG